MTRKQQHNDTGTTKQVTHQRLVLLANGYLPIPVIGKQSFLEGWATITPTKDVIRGWEYTQAEPGTGVLTRTNPAINIDITDAATAQAIEDLTRNYFNGVRLLCRIWQPPKRAFLFRASVPFAKLQTWFTAPDGSGPYRISILGDGQMLTVEAKHPVTGQPCTWPDGDPWRVPTTELQVLTEASARAWLAAITDLLVARGWRRNSTVAATARDYHDNHHWVPLRLEGKNPQRFMGKGWQKRTLQDGVPDFQTGDNIGILLGAPSGDIVRLDPDWPPVPEITDILFPEPTAIFERASAPRYGRLFKCPGFKTKNFQLPKIMEKDERLPLTADGTPKLIVYQILSTGAQTMAPPSIHPNNGEQLFWVKKCEPGALSEDELIRRGGIEAFLLAVRHFWPARGERNLTAMALTRVLLETFADLGREERCNIVNNLVLNTAMAGGDGERSREGKERAEAQLDRMETGEETMGLPKLLEYLELPEALATTFRKWLQLGSEQVQHAVTLEDFHAYMPMHNYIFIPSREHWPTSSVNARIPPVPTPVFDEKGEQVKLKASTWLDQNRAVEQMTWAPGLPMLIPDRLVSDGGWIIRPGVKCFNLYRPPTLELGDAARAGPWLEHANKVFGNDADHITKWLAHRVQHPGEKINHALVFGSKKQGAGKDTLLEPVKHAIGPWNFHEVSPAQVTRRFNGFLKSVILRINEARDLGDVNRYQFYDHMKAYTAAPPDVLRVDEKNLREHSIFNCVGVILTTNYKTDGIYLPAEDRRHYVAWSERSPEDFAKGYWDKLWGWYRSGGIGHVAAYLAALDISAFDPKAPPPKTEAFWAIVDANRAPEESELADVFDALGNPDVVTLAKIINKTKDIIDDKDLYQWLTDRRNRRAIPHRLERCGYVPVRNTTREDGLWIVNRTRQVVYARASLLVRDQLAAAQRLEQ
jgi:uncharacterized protein DUF5906